METLNMMSVPVERFIREVRDSIEDENYDPIIGIGKSGVGKTESIKELADDMGLGFCEMRLVTLGELDMLGLPSVENGRTTYAANALLPDAARDGERGILVLDEITSATATVRAAAYQLLDAKRSLGNYKLPPKWKVVALGNGPDDGGVFSGIEYAFLSRCQCFRIEPDVESWTHWATKHEINPTVIAYIKFAPADLHLMNPDEMASVFPCPRSWTALARKLTKREAKAQKGTLSRDDVEFYAAGYVGASKAPEFAAFYAFKETVIDTQSILQGTATTDVKRMEPQTVYLTAQNACQALITEVKKHKQGNDFDDAGYQITCNVINWLLGISQVKIDYGFTAFTDIGAGYPEIMTIITSDKFERMCPGLSEFIDAHGATVDRF